MAAIPLVASPLAEALRGLNAGTFPTLLRPHAIPLRLLLLLLPQALVLTLPAGLLLGFPLAFSRGIATSQRMRRGLAIAAVYVLATGAVLVWGVPRANQEFRILISGNPSLAPGPREIGFAALRERIETLNLTPGGRVAARPLEWLYQVRFALICTPLPIAWLALALTTTSLGRRRPLLTGALGLVAYVFVYYPIVAGAEDLVRVSILPPTMLAWLPILGIVLLAAAIARIGLKASSSERLA
jgi:lipopolysaccharide export LptBFGC system permease protein LptF